MREALDSKLVTVKGGPFPPFGTAFQVHRDAAYSYFLTAAHVIKEKLKDESGARTIWVGEHEATVVAVGNPDATPDIAVLKTSCVDEPVCCLRTISGVGFPGIVPGYSLQQKARIRNPINVKISKELFIVASDGGEGDPVWEVETTDEDGRPLEHGYSGSPLIIPGTNAVVGLVFVRDGKRGQAIAIERLQRIWRPWPNGLIIEKLGISPRQAQQLPVRRSYVSLGAAQVSKSNNFFGDAFISAHCQRRELLGSKEEERDEAINVVRQVLLKQGGGAAFLGEYGSGKTCLCQQLFLLFGNEYLENSDTRHVPLLGRLAEARFDQTKDVEAWATAFIYRQLKRYYPGVTSQDAEQFFDAGRVVFIFDGLDEMPSSGTTEAMRECLKFLELFLERRGAENFVIVTSRTAFFASRGEELRLKGFKTFEITEWGDTEWRECLRRANAAERENDLDRVFAIRELARKPYFVELILAQMDSLISLAKARPDGKILASDLYELFLTQAIAKNFTRFRSKMVDETDHRRALQQIALRMVNTYNFRATLDLIREIALQSWSQELPVEEKTSALSDLLANTLFHRVGDDMYAFPHPSIIEFLAAEALAGATTSGRFDAYGKRIYYTEIFAFAAELHREPELCERLLDFIHGVSLKPPLTEAVDMESENIIANLLTLLRVIFEASLWSKAHSVRYREILLNFLGWTEATGLQVRYAAAFSLWRCPMDESTVATIRLLYDGEPFSLTRRVLWHTLRYFERRAPEIFQYVKVPAARSDDAFNPITKVFFENHQSAADSLLSVALGGGANPVERGAYWIVVIAAEIALTSADEPRVLASLFRDLASREEDLRECARLCLHNFWVYHPHRRDEIRKAAMERIVAKPDLGETEHGFLLALLAKVETK